MRILFNNVDFSSNSGPNNFGKKIATQLFLLGHEINVPNPDVAINFIQGYVPGIKNTLRLDGIYFNSAQDWESLNNPIRKSYELSDLAVFQSSFNKDLIFKYFGSKEKFAIIHNGTSFEEIEKIPAMNSNIPRENVWMCASSWRPHKRLSDNIEYFLEFSKKEDILIVAGENSNIENQKFSDRIKFVGNLNWSQMISCMKSSKNFLHLAFLDHCPNVVVDARACGCKIICSSSGGTKEIAGLGAVIVQDLSWDFSPIDLYNPPKLDFSNLKISDLDCDINIKSVSFQYVKAMEAI